MKVYFSSVEYKYEPGKGPIDGLKGGFVYAFVKAKDVRDALSKLSEEFDKLNLTVLEVEHLYPYDEADTWDNKTDQKRYDKLAKEAEGTDKVVFDNFYAYEEG